MHRRNSEPNGEQNGERQTFSWFEMPQSQVKKKENHVSLCTIIPFAPPRTQSNDTPAKFLDNRPSVRRSARVIGPSLVVQAAAAFAKQHTAVARVCTFHQLSLCTCTLPFEFIVLGHNLLWLGLRELRSQRSLPFVFLLSNIPIGQLQL